MPNRFLASTLLRPWTEYQFSFGYADCGKASKVPRQAIAVDLVHAGEFDVNGAA